MPFKKAVPRVATIDPVNFLLLSKGRRKKTCRDACRCCAIGFEMNGSAEAILSAP